MAYPVPDNEAGRLEALDRLNVLDTRSEAPFDRLAQIAKQVFDLSYSAVSLVAEDRQWFKASCGWDFQESPREHSICTYVVADHEPLVVEDTTEDERFANLPAVTGSQNLRFYAGAPLMVAGGHCVGTLCVSDDTPRHFGEEDRALLTQLAGVASDLLEARQKAYQVSYLTSALEQVEEPVFTIEGTPESPSDAEITWANQNYTETVGQDPAELIGSTPRIFEELPSDPETRRRVLQALKEGETVRGETAFHLQNGAPKVISWILAPVRDEMGQITHWVCVQRDITEQKEREATLKHKATHDPLTGLLNRVAIERQVQQALDDPERSGTMLYLDLDRFKRINDTFGHSAGDELLKEVAVLLADHLRKETSVARIGGDEFAIWLPSLTGEEAATSIAERICDAFEDPFSVQGEELYVGTSIGIVADVSGYNSAETVFRDADVAMYEAKRSTDHSYVVHEPSMTEEVGKRLRLDTVLRKAVEEEAFEPAFHPIVRLEDGALVGLEVLARWRREDGRLSSPSAFLEVAEETGLIIPIGHQVIEEACRVLQRLQAEKSSDLFLTLSGNFSRREFFQAETYDFISHLLSTYDLVPENFTVEITERVIGDETAEKQRPVRELKELGINIEIDDFGTGYSSLHSLLEFPADGLKIDKALTAKLGSSEKAHHLVRSVIDLSRALGLYVTAEGIETAEQLSLLRNLGCPYGQGYLFSRPVLPGELNALIDTSPWSFSEKQ